jgi:hypothetical protein
MEKLPLFLSIFFVFITFLTVYFFWKAAGHSKKILLIIATWLVLQTILGLQGFYLVTDTIPPRLVLMIAPVAIAITLLFITSTGRKFIDGLDIKYLTLLSIVRIPVELILFWLFTYKAIPEIMTFEGRNLDIISGLTAPLIYYFGFIKHKLSWKFILFWNFLCLGFLLNVVVYGILSAPSVIQKFSFDQPNIAILYFPFVWLPACVVALALFSHLVSIRQLLKSRTADTYQLV